MNVLGGMDQIGTINGVGYVRPEICMKQVLLVLSATTTEHGWLAFIFPRTYFCFVNSCADFAHENQQFHGLCPRLALVVHHCIRAVGVSRCDLRLRERVCIFTQNLNTFSAVHFVESGS